MKMILSTVTVLALLSTGALAQTMPSPSGTAPSPATGTTAPTAPASALTVNASPLENGANSFTEGQASERFREAGITAVTGLAKDADGVWRGRGQWQGRAVAIGIDYRGTIQAR